MMAHSGKALLFIGSAFVVFMVAVSAFTSSPTDSRSQVQRIADGCKREFGYSQNDVTPTEFECTVRALNRWTADLDRQKMDRVYRSSY